MKVRSGFVSNSSSSSFIIFGKRIRPRVISDIYNKHVFAVGHANRYDDGDDIFELTDDMFGFILANGLRDEFVFYDTQYWMDAEDVMDIPIPKDLKDECTITVLNKDYNQSQGTDDLRRAYVDED